MNLRRRKEKLEILMGIGDGFQMGEDGALFIPPLGSETDKSTPAFPVDIPLTLVSEFCWYFLLSFTYSRSIKQNIQLEQKYPGKCQTHVHNETLPIMKTAVLYSKGLLTPTFFLRP